MGPRSFRPIVGPNVRRAGPIIGWLPVRGADRRSASLRRAISGSHAADQQALCRLPLLDGRSADEIIGYDEFGVPH
jgi:hypothetical protein